MIIVIIIEQYGENKADSGTTNSEVQIFNTLNGGASVEPRESDIHFIKSGIRWIHKFI